MSTRSGLSVGDTMEAPNSLQQNISPARTGAVGNTHNLVINDSGTMSNTPESVTSGSQSCLTVGNQSEGSGASHTDLVSVMNASFSTSSRRSSSWMTQESVTDRLSVANGDRDSGYSSCGSEQGGPAADSNYYYVDTKTGKKASQSRLYYPRVPNNLLKTTYPRIDVDALLQDLQKDHCPARRAEIRKLVQISVIPDLADNKNYCDIASFLKVNDRDVQFSAISYLKTMLLDVRSSQDRSVTEQLLQVAKSSQDAFFQLCEDDAHLLPMTSLHVMAMSAVLSRCPQPSLEQCQALAISKKVSKKKSWEGLKQQMMKALQLFHEGVEAVLDKASSFQQWSQAGFSEEDRTKRKGYFTRASFCELMVNVFTLLNEVKYQAWNRKGEMLAVTLQDLHQSSTRSGKDTLKDESKAVMDFAIVDGLVLLLESVFQEDESQVGDQKSKHIDHITSLMLDVIKGANSSPLVSEVECLPFHSALQVKRTFNMFFRTKNRAMGSLAQGHMENQLRLIGFHRDSATQCDQTGSQDSCTWQTFKCSIGQNEAEGVMYIPKASCLAANRLGVCVEEHPGCTEECAIKRAKIAERSQRHVRHLDILKEHSLQCRRLLQLFSYQLLPFPFYITEQVQQRRLLSHLLDHRDSKLWLDTPTLTGIMFQVIEALQYLTSRSIDPRDVTAYNMVVQPGASSHRQSFGQRCSALSNGGFEVKLADLGLAHEFLHTDDCDVRPVRSQGAVPLRWTSPEALFEGRYGEKNMVYSAGCVMYELWTHGCQPFTSYDHNMDTDSIFIKMMMEPGSVQLTRWPCTPQAVHDVIKRCTGHTPNTRPSLGDLKTDLENILKESGTHNAREPGLLSALSSPRLYPNVSPSQTKRHHVPETGIPTSIQQLIDAGKNSTLYDNTRKSIWQGSNDVMVTEEELATIDKIYIENTDDRTSVREVVSSKFVRDVLPSIEVSKLEGVTSWSRSEESSPRLSQENGVTIHKREYPQSISFQTASEKGYLLNQCHIYDMQDGDPLDNRVLVPLISLARAVHGMHEKGWIIRDLKPDAILIDCSNGQVTLPRIGRAHRLQSSERYYIDEVFEDSRRWLAPEVLLSGQYGKENDIFMLGTVIWQFFRIRELAERDPLASHRDFAPCANTAKDQVVNYVRDGIPLPFPSRFPDWLYDLILSCRHPDPATRPSAQDVLHTLQEHSAHGPLPMPFIDVARNQETLGAEPSTDDFNLPPHVQLRKKKKHSTRKPAEQKSNLFKSVKKRLTRKKSKGVGLQQPVDCTLTTAGTRAEESGLDSSEQTDLKQFITNSAGAAENIENTYMQIPCTSLSRCGGTVADESGLDSSEQTDLKQFITNSAGAAENTEDTYMEIPCTSLSRCGGTVSDESGLDSSEQMALNQYTTNSTGASSILYSKAITGVCTSNSFSGYRSSVGQPPDTQKSTFYKYLDDELFPFEKSGQGQTPSSDECPDAAGDTSRRPMSICTLYDVIEDLPCTSLSRYGGTGADESGLDSSEQTDLYLSFNTNGTEASSIIPPDGKNSEEDFGQNGTFSYPLHNSGARPNEFGKSDHGRKKKGFKNTIKNFVSFKSFRKKKASHQHLHTPTGEGKRSKLTSAAGEESHSPPPQTSLTQAVNLERLQEHHDSLPNERSFPSEIEATSSRSEYRPGSRTSMVLGDGIPGHTEDHYAACSSTSSTRLHAQNVVTPREVRQQIARDSVTERFDEDSTDGLSQSDVSGSCCWSFDSDYYKDGEVRHHVQGSENEPEQTDFLTRLLHALHNRGFHAQGGHTADHCSLCRGNAAEGTVVCYENSTQAADPHDVFAGEASGLHDGNTALQSHHEQRDSVGDGIYCAAESSEESERVYRNTAEVADRDCFHTSKENETTYCNVGNRDTLDGCAVQTLNPSDSQRSGVSDQQPRNNLSLLSRQNNNPVHASSTSLYLTPFSGR